MLIWCSGILAFLAHSFMNRFLILEIDECYIAKIKKIHIFYDIIKNELKGHLIFNIFWFKIKMYQKKD